MADGVRVAFVGCGNIARYHATAALKAGGVTITALIDPNAKAREQLAEFLQREAADAQAPQQFDTLKEAVTADPDFELFNAVDIMVPSFVVDGADLHELVATEALRARRHVLLEKPVTTHPEAAVRLDALHREVAPDRVLAVAENAQFWPEVLAAKASLDRGDIGELLTVRVKAWESATGEWAIDYAEGGWRCDESKLPSASFTFDSASHWIRPLRMWMGRASRVVGVTGKSIKHMAGVSFSQHIITFQSSKSAVFETMLAPKAISDQPFFVLQGSLGEIVVEGFGGGCTLHTLCPETDKPVSRELCREGWNASYVGEYADFVSAVSNGTPTKGPLSEALADLRVVQALINSGEQGAWVDID